MFRRRRRSVAVTHAGPVGVGHSYKRVGRWGMRLARRALPIFLVITIVTGQLVALAPPALGAGAPVAGLSLSLSTDASAASQVTYTIDFTTSVKGALAANTGTISVQAPAGTFPAPPLCSGTISVSDLTTHVSDTTASMCFSEVGNQGSLLVISSPVAIAADNRVELVVPGLDNPAAIGPQTLAVRTSSDSASSVGFHLMPAASIKGLSVSLSDHQPGASAVTYTVEFATSNTGALAENTGTISVQAPEGTSRPRRRAPAPRRR